MARNGRPVTVTLGELQDHVDRRVRSGTYASASEVMRAAVRALDREEASLDELIRKKVEEAWADPRPNVSAEHVLDRIRTLHEAGVKADRGE